MSQPNAIQSNEKVNSDSQWESIYILGAITTAIVILGTVLDIIIGNILGGDLSTIPKTATERFTQFNDNWLLGLYNLDMLNLLTTILMVPTYFALYAAHRRVNSAYAQLSLIVYIIAAAVFIANNVALPMYELSKNYANTTIEAQKSLFAAAGESLLIKGAHGSLGAFYGFVLSTLASIIMSFGMLRGKVFSKTNSYFGIIGGLLLLVYLILVTFVPETKSLAMVFATPGGLLSLIWMIMFTIKLFKISKS